LVRGTGGGVVGLPGGAALFVPGAGAEVVVVAGAPGFLFVTGSAVVVVT
jgi:hypothetical protein